MKKKSFLLLFPFLALLVILASTFLLIATHPAHAQEVKAPNPWAIKSASLDPRQTTGFWAYDTYTLRYEKAGTDSFILHFDTAFYTTVAGPSPAGGHHTDALKRDRFTGWIKFTVSGGNFNPDAMCSVHWCTGDTFAQGIMRFTQHVFGSLALPTIGDSCFLYGGGDHDGDLGDAMQVASLGVSCSILGVGDQGDIFV